MDDTSIRLPFAVRSEALVATPNAGRYLRQLCAHFGRNRPVAFDERAGRIAFTIGECRLDAEHDRLIVSLGAAGGAEMATLMGVMHRHLQRLAFAEELTIRWGAASAG